MQENCTFSIIPYGITISKIFSFPFKVPNDSTISSFALSPCVLFISLTLRNEINCFFGLWRRCYFSYFFESEAIFCKESISGNLLVLKNEIG